MSGVTVSTVPCCVAGKLLMIVSKASLTFLVSRNSKDNLFTFILSISHWSKDTIMVLSNSAFGVRCSIAHTEGIPYHMDLPSAVQPTPAIHPVQVV